MTKEERKILRSTWEGMLRRCKPNHRQHKRYYDRGITVCEEWKDFEIFVADMGPRPEGTSIDRIDNDRGYFKENCRWATPKQQMRNTSVNVYIMYEGKRRPAIEVSEKIGIQHVTLLGRIKAGWDHTVAVERPVAKRVRGEQLSYPISKKFTNLKEGKLKTELRFLIAESGKSLRSIAEQAGVKYALLWRWYNKKTWIIDADMAETVVLSLRKKGGEKP